ncbi:MAG: extracellular solute-binding protein [Candidatus Promineifilaceae bacterium]|jgi:ABC-type glycerol-3-phosphate transport system substrate-binding protein
MRSRRALIITLIAALLLTACNILPDTGEAGESPAPTATAELAAETSTVPNVPNVPMVATPAEETTTLRVWIPPVIGQRTDAGALTMIDQISRFDLENEDINVLVEQKRDRGSGGIVDYLRTGREVAPSILPDLVAVPTDLLPTMAAENLIQPLDDRLDNDALEDLYPPALALARPASTLLGYPFALGTLPHLAYNNNALSGTLPLTWEPLVENEDHSYVFAADGTDGALLALQFYLDAGGKLADESGQPILELDPLAEALQYIENGRMQGFFTPQSSTLTTTDQAWQNFLSGGGNIVQTTADHFLSQSVEGLPIAYTIIPGIDSPLTPLVDGWAWALTTTDTNKQAQAVALIQDLTTAENLGAWSRESNILPARRNALQAWPGDDPYVGFVGQELERAQPLAVSSSSTLLTVLGDAVFQVVSGGKTAQQAAADALSAMGG